jgi:hypothetical protein
MDILFSCTLALAAAGYSMHHQDYDPEEQNILIKVFT